MRGLLNRRCLRSGFRTRGVNVSLAGPLRGDLRVEAQGCSLSAEVPAVSIDREGQECLAYAGLNGDG